MGGGKGSKTTTTTQVNPVQQAQQPYLEDAWKRAQGLYNQYNDVPGSSIADVGQPWQKEGYQNIYNAGNEINQWMQEPAYRMWRQGGAGDVYNSPAYNYFQNMAQNATGPQQQYANLGGLAQAAGQNYANQIAGYAPQIADWARMAGANNNLGLSTLGQVAQGQGLGMGQLGQTASGQYLNGNPYFAAMVQNAMDPITRNYQTSIAPQLDASFMNSGRYGSGAMLGQRENAQNTLADNLAKMSQNMYGQNYANERQQQIAAANQYAALQGQTAGQYGQLYNQGLGMGLQGLANAANVQQGAANTYQQGLSQAMNALNPQLNAMMQGAQGLQGAYQSGNAAALNAAQIYPQLAQAEYNQGQAQLQAGQGMNDIQRQYIDEPANLLDRYLKQIGAIQGGSASTTSPYFTNPMANAMAGITGGMDIMQKMGGMGGLGGGGMGGGYPATINSPSGTWVNGTGMGSGIYTNMANGFTSDQSGSGFPGIPQGLGMAANAAKKL